MRVDLNEIWPRDKGIVLLFFSSSFSAFLYLTPAISNGYKLDEAIRVQLRESAEIRKRESMQMGEATLVSGFGTATHIYSSYLDKENPNFSIAHFSLLHYFMKVIFTYKKPILIISTFVRTNTFYYFFHAKQRSHSFCRLN